MNDETGTSAWTSASLALLVGANSESCGGPQEDETRKLAAGITEPDFTRGISETLSSVAGLGVGDLYYNVPKFRVDHQSSAIVTV